MKIKYDKKSVKKYRIITLICIALFILPFLLEKYINRNSFLFDYFIYISLICWYTGLFVGSYCGLKYISGRLYLSNLQKNGYSIPTDMKDYDCDLANLPRDASVVSQLSLEDRNSTSYLLFQVCITIFVICISWNIWYYLKWAKYGSDSTPLTIFMCIANLYWFISSIRYHIQADNSRYRDDCEPADGRKCRKSVSRAVVGIFFFCVVALVGKTSIYNMTEYVHKSHIAAEKDTLSEILAALEKSYIDLDSADARQQIKDELTAGVNLADKYSSTDSYWISVTTILGDINTLNHHFLLENKEPVIHAQIQNGYIVVTIENANNIMDMPIFSKGKNLIQ